MQPKNKSMTEKQHQQIEKLLNNRRIDDIHKKSVTNALRQGLTSLQAGVVIKFLKSLIAFKRSVVELIEDYARHVALER
jgi:hypothetical protein